MSFFKPARKTTIFTLATLSVALLSAHEVREASPERASIPAGPRAEAADATGAQGAPFDVGEVMRRVRSSYREEADGWHGGHSSYDVHASERGLTLTPIHREEVESGAPGELPGPAAGREGPKVEEGAPLLLGAARVTRGGARVDSGAARGAVADDGHLALERGAVVEHLRNGETGVEQSWSFESAPAGSGELVVEIPTEGIVYKETSGTGLHFADARTGLGFQYGHGTWVDAQGRRTAVLAEYDVDHIELHVPESVLAGSSYPAVLDPVISAEMLVDGRLVAVDTVAQQYPAIASNGSTYLLVWENYRTGRTDVRAARISAAGDLLDPSGFALSTGAGRSLQPAVASNGTDFLVTWMHDDGWVWGARAARVAASGEVGEESVVAGSSGGSYPQGVSVASNGTDYLATWYLGYGWYDEPDQDTFARRISAAGDPIGQEIAIAADPTRNESNPQVASNGDGYLIAWNDSRGHWPDEYRAYAARVSNEGEIVDPDGFPLSIDCAQYIEAIGSNGEDYLVTWVDLRSSWSLYGTRVTSEGVVTDGEGLAISADAAILETSSQVGSDGADYLVAWTARQPNSSGGQILARHVSGDLPAAQAILDVQALEISRSTEQRNAAVAHSDVGYLVVWDGAIVERPGVRDIYQRLVPGGLPWRVAFQSLPAVTQTEPAVASNGEGFLVVWTETTPNSIAIFGARLTASGSLVDRVPFTVANAPRERGAPAVATNGEDYFVTWMDFRDQSWDIFGARVLGSGAAAAAVLDPGGFPISQHPAFQDSPAVASNGADYLVVWRHDMGQRGDIRGARVSSTGAVWDTDSIPIATNVTEHYAPRVASNTGDYLVVWTEDRGATSWDVVGARVSPWFASADSPIVISDASREQFEPEVTSDGVDYFVVWSDYRSNTSHDVYGGRVTADGEAPDGSGVVICDHGAQQRSPKVVYDGVNYVAAWTDSRWTGWDVFGTQITGSGGVLSPGGAFLANDVGTETPRISLASTYDEQSFVTYSRYDTLPDLGNQRILGSAFRFQY